METPTTYAGTWEEVKSHEAELAGRYVQVKILTEPGVAERLARLERGREIARAASKELGLLPERRFSLDVLYPDEDEPRS